MEAIMQTNHPDLVLMRHKNGIEDNPAAQPDTPAPTDAYFQSLTYISGLIVVVSCAYVSFAALRSLARWSVGDGW
jgi:hypothetical protein